MMRHDRCPDCDPKDQSKDQRVYDCTDGTFRCMNCRAHFERPPKGKKERKATPPVVRPEGPRKGPPPTVPDQRVKDVCATSGRMADAVELLGISAAAIRSRCKTLGIPWPGKGESRGCPGGGKKMHQMTEGGANNVTAADETVTAEEPADPVAPPVRDYDVAQFAEVTSTHGDQRLAVRHAVNEHGVLEQILVEIDGDVFSERLPGMWYKLARMILEHERVETAG